MLGNPPLCGAPPVDSHNRGRQGECNRAGRFHHEDARGCALETLMKIGASFTYETMLTAAYYALEGWRGCDFEEGTEWIKAGG